MDCQPLFTRSCRNIEHLQFYLTEVSTTPPSMFKIVVRYKMQPIATIEITKRRIIIRTTDKIAGEIFSIAKQNNASVNI